MQGVARKRPPVYVLDTEGGVLAEEGGNAPPRMAAYVRDSGYGEILAGYIFWGSRLRDAFREAEALPADRLHLTGCPRFDYAAPRWRSLLDRERRGYLLVNANFPLVNPRFSRSPGAERETMVRAGWDPGYVDRFLVDLEGVFQAYIAQVRRLAEARPDRRFLVRPHPFERADAYGEAFAGLANVTVDGAGSVLEVIRNAEAVLHLNCGTAIEAVMLGVLPIQMEHLNTPVTAAHATLPARISRKVHSEAALLDAIDDLASERAGFDFEGLHAREIAPFFHRNDGRATARVVDVLTADGADGEGFVSLAEAARGSRLAPTPGQRLKAAVTTLAGSAIGARLQAHLAPARRDKAIAPEAVAGLVRDVAAADGDAPGAYAVGRARCRRTGLPLATIRVAAERISAR